ncbi:MAG TPA: MoaD/ThiS family protein [Eoetvoesiella sp.]
MAELMGRREELQPLSQAVTVADWLAQLEAIYPQLSPAKRLKIAINQDYANRSALIQPGDEVAVFEPVTGG